MQLEVASRAKSPLLTSASDLSSAVARGEPRVSDPACQDPCPVTAEDKGMDWQLLFVHALRHRRLPPWAKVGFAALASALRSPRDQAVDSDTRDTRQAKSLHPVARPPSASSALTR